MKALKVSGAPRPPAPREIALAAARATPPGDAGVDTDTEVLTQRGWLGYDEVTCDDSAYALDFDSLTAGFEEITDVRVFAAEPRQMRHLEVGGFSSLATPAQSWPVRFRRSAGYRAFTLDTEWRHTRRIGAKVGIIRTRPDRDAPRRRTYSDAFVEIVAWIWNEGCLTKAQTKRPRITIAQSHTANPAKCDQIRAALRAEFPGGFCEIVSHERGRMEFELYADPSAEVLGVIEAHKMPTCEFVLALTREQLLLFIDVSMAGDGHTTEAGVRRWAQLRMESIRRFEMICALAGVPTNTRFKAAERYESHFGGDMHQVSLLRTDYVQPVDSLAELRGGRRKGGRVEAADEWVEHHGIVWRPVTPSGTWLARRNGSVYFTGGERTRVDGATVPRVVATSMAPRVSRSARGEQLCLDLGSLIA